MSGVIDSIGCMYIYIYIYIYIIHVYVVYVCVVQNVAQDKHAIHCVVSGKWNNKFVLYCLLTTLYVLTHTQSIPKWLDVMAVALPILPTNIKLLHCYLRAAYYPFSRKIRRGPSFSHHGLTHNSHLYWSRALRWVIGLLIPYELHCFEVE